MEGWTVERLIRALEQMPDKQDRVRIAFEDRLGGHEIREDVLQVSAESHPGEDGNIVAVRARHS